MIILLPCHIWCDLTTSHPFWWPHYLLTLILPTYHDNTYLPWYYLLTAIIPTYPDITYLPRYCLSIGSFISLYKHWLFLYSTTQHNFFWVVYKYIYSRNWAAFCILARPDQGGTRTIFQARHWDWAHRIFCKHVLVCRRTQAYLWHTIRQLFPPRVRLRAVVARICLCTARSALFCELCDPWLAFVSGGIVVNTGVVTEYLSLC